PVVLFLFKQKTAYKILRRLEFRRVLFRSEEAPRLKNEPGRAQRLEDVDRGRPGDRRAVGQGNTGAGERRDRIEGDGEDSGDDTRSEERCGWEGGVARFSGEWYREVM